VESGYNPFYQSRIRTLSGEFLRLDLPPTILRRATQADKPEWLRMRCLLWPHENAVRMGLELDSLLASPGKPVFVLERQEGGLGGFLEAGTREYADGCQTSPVGYIEGWFVDVDLRGRGLGRALVSAAETWARAQGLHEIASDTALANNDGRMAHLALGYSERERSIHFSKSV
jgi:aminoglycoside 6'-N-acetyltransferase I